MQIKNEPTESRDEEVFDVIERVGDQYAAYLELQDTLATILTEEPDETAHYGWDHPLTLVVRDSR